MKKYLLLNLLLFNFLLTVTAQFNTLDSNIYTSEFERDVFDRWHDSIDVEPLDYFVAMDFDKAEYIKVKKQIFAIEDELKNEGLKSKSIKKQVKLIYKKVHSKILKKYSEEATFYDIPSSGVYNCVTASAMYAIILSHFQINYSVMERPQHVYLIVNPNEDDIIMESTNPNNGVLIIDDKAKRDYVKYLRSNKLISEKEYEEKSIDELFKQNFNEDKSINIQQLAGLQYYNKGTQFMKKELYLKANPCFEKGLILYPKSKLIRFSYNSSLSLSLNQQISKDIYHGDLLGKFIYLNASSGEAMDMALNSFKIVTDRLAMRHPDIDSYTDYYNSMISEVPDTVDLSKFSNVFYFYKAYYYFVDQNYTSALEELSKAYNVNSDDIHTRQLIHETALKLIIDENHLRASVDTFDYYLKDYPFLLNDKDLQNIYVLFHYGAIEEAYRNGDDKQADEYWKRTQQMFVEYDSLNYDREAVAEFYSETYYHYNARYKAKLAKEYLAEGRKMFPESEKLAKLAKQSIYTPHHDNDIVVYESKSLEEKHEDFQKKFTQVFKGCWKAVSSYKVGKEDIVTKTKNTFKIEVLKSKNIKFSKDNKTQLGKWSLRSKSKLLYLIPDNDKSAYDIYKVVKVTENEIHLRVYKDRKKTNVVLILKKCS